MASVLRGCPLDPSAWGQEVREERIGILEGPAAHGDDAKGERRLPAHHVQWEARVPSLAVRPRGANPCTHVPTPGAKLLEVHTPRRQQALEGRLSLPGPQCTVMGSVCARASGAPRKQCFPSQWGYFWLCSCSHCGNCTCPVQCGNMTSFPREVYSKPAAKKLLVRAECVCLPLSPPAPPPHTTPSPLSLCLCPEAVCGGGVFLAAW